MNTNEIIAKLTEIGGKEWQKNGMHRVYFEPATMAHLGGLDWNTYGSGHISSATLNGSTISNSEAQRILASGAGAKFWYDATNGKFFSKDPCSELGKYQSVWTAGFTALNRSIGIEVA